MVYNNTYTKLPFQNKGIIKMQKKGSSPNPIKEKHRTSTPHAPYNNPTHKSVHDNLDTESSPNTHR